MNPHYINDKREKERQLKLLPPQFKKYVDPDYKNSSLHSSSIDLDQLEDQRNEPLRKRKTDQEEEKDLPTRWNKE